MLLEHGKAPSQMTNTEMYVSWYNRIATIGAQNF
jgi:hypothetical protein